MMRDQRRDPQKFTFIPTLDISREELGEEWEQKE